jgi:dTDP-4-amino-4,6-dideoxygalactose transaminase
MRVGTLERSERLVTEVLSLPLYPELFDDEIGSVVSALADESGSRRAQSA